MQSELLFKVGFIGISSTVLVAVAAGCLLWIQYFRGRTRKNLCGDVSPDLITRMPQPLPRWTVFDFILMFGIMIMVGSLMQPPPKADAVPETDVAMVEPDMVEPDSAPAVDVVQVATDPEADADKLVKQIKTHFAANVGAFLLTLVYLRIVHGATLTHLSLLPTFTDLRRGLYATVWILAPVLVVNVVVANFVQYKHPVTDLLAAESGTRTFIALFCSAAIVTPIVEEFQFRLLLQGGLQRLADVPMTGERISLWHPTSAWPIYVTSLLFALMHAGQGAAPIPLFFLAVGLGFLYQRTGRLFPAIIVHMLLNGTTLSMEFCRANAGL